MNNKLINEVAGVNPEIIKISRDVLEQMFEHLSNSAELTPNDQNDLSFL